MSLTIRQAQADDAPLLARLNISVQQLHADHFPQRFKPLQPDDPALLAFYDKLLADPTCVIYLAAWDGEAAGYVVCMVKDSAGNAFIYPAKTLLVDQLSVSEAFRRRGIGRALMERAASLARDVGADSIQLTVWTFNEEAIAFYKQLGYDVAMLKMVKPLT